MELEAIIQSVENEKEDVDPEIEIEDDYEYRDHYQYNHHKKNTQWNNRSKDNLNLSSSLSSTSFTNEMFTQKMNKFGSSYPGNYGGAGGRISSSDNSTSSLSFSGLELAEKREQDTNTYLAQQMKLKNST